MAQLMEDPGPQPALEVAHGTSAGAHESERSTVPGVTEGALSMLLESGLLSRAAAQVAARLAAEPDQPLLWRRLGDLFRQAGDLERAAEAYERLRALEPGDAGVERLLAILRGEPLPCPPAVWPARFLRIENFLPPERLRELREFTASRREEFAPTPVMEDGRAVLRPDVRWCENIWEIEPVTRWFEPLVAERIQEFAAQLQVSPDRFEIRDCKLTHYGDGSYFRRHIDRGPGAESRVFGFVYYFHFPPKRFEGGGLAIYDWDLETGEAAATCTTVVPEQNQLLVLSSHCWHEVLPVRCESGEWDAGRFTLNGWICRAG